MENQIFTIDTEYIRANITVEIINVISGIDGQGVVYLFNWKGIMFTVCTNILEIANVINGEEGGVTFDTDEEAMNYIKTIKLL